MIFLKKKAINKSFIYLYPTLSFALFPSISLYTLFCINVLNNRNAQPFFLFYRVMFHSQKKRSPSFFFFYRIKPDNTFLIKPYCLSLWALHKKKGLKKEKNVQKRKIKVLVSLFSSHSFACYF